MLAALLAPMQDNDQDVPVIRGGDEDEVDNYGEIPDAAAILPNGSGAPGEKKFGRVIIVPSVCGLTCVSSRSPFNAC